MKRNSKLNINHSIPGIKPGKLNRLVLQITQEDPREIPILSNELDLLSGHIDSVVAYVAKSGKIEGE